MTPQRFIPLLTTLPLLLWATGVGCALFGGGDKAPPKARGYQVTAPSEWREDDKAEGDYAYRLPSGSLATLNSSCTRNTNAPLEVLTKHLLFGSRNVEIEKREKLSVAGEQGLYSQVKATVDGVPFHLHLFVLPKSGCVFDFSLMSPRNISQKEGDDFLAFVKSLRHGSN